MCTVYRFATDQKELAYGKINIAEEHSLPPGEIFCFWSHAFGARAGIFKPLWSPGIDAKASIPPACVARRAGTITLFLLGA
jgi:hypothetical protein